MASLLKKKGRYFLQFFDAGKRVKRKTIALKTGDKRTALTLKAFHEAEFALGKWSPWESPQNTLRSTKEARESKEPKMVQEAVEAFLASRVACRRATRDHYRWVLSLFEATIPTGRKIESLTAADVTSWLVSQSPNANTRQSYLSRIGIFFRWCIAQGWMDRDLTKEVTLSRPPDKLRKKLILPSQVDQLIEVAKDSKTPYMAAVIMIAFDHALRLSEVCSLRWDWIDFDRSILMVQSDLSFTTKTGKSALKPLSLRSASLLKSTPHLSSNVLMNSRGNPLEPKHTSKTFKSLVRKMGLSESISFHSLRHGALSAALSGGASVEAVRMFAGHSSVQMTMRYVHLQEDQYAQQITRALYPKH